ncbi:MAG: hypothetical protein E6H79_21645, partial [Betaproteobacteria bacterium]
MNVHDAGVVAPARPRAADDITLIRPVIIAGGSGTRLWPLSRGQMPKQFLALAGSGGKTLFQQSLLRTVVLAAPNASVAAPIVVGNEAHRFMLLDQMRELMIEPAAVLLEPEGRNTAPAL